MRVPGLGESKAHICDEDAEQLLCYLHGSAFSLVSYNSFHVVHPDKFNHSEPPLLLTYQTAEIYLHLLCPMKCLFVKYNDGYGYVWGELEAARSECSMPAACSGCSLHHLSQASAHPP